MLYSRFLLVIYFTCMGFPGGSDNFTCMGFPGGSDNKESACNAGNLDLIPGLGISPGEQEGYLLQYSGLENFMDCIVHGVAKSRTWLTDFHFHQNGLFTNSYICSKAKILGYHV